MTLRLAPKTFSSARTLSRASGPGQLWFPVLWLQAQRVFLHLSRLHDAFHSRTPTDAACTLRAVAVDKETPGPVIFPTWCQMQAISNAQSEELISVKTALSPMWHQSKQLVILLSTDKNSSLMDWFFTFQPARVGMSPGWCLPSMWAGWGPARVAVVVLAAAPRSHWPQRCLVWGLGQQKGAKFGKLITDGAECVSSLT